ncbi:MAG TPA: glycoside hydrolase family 125 protein [Candidatus Acidoferrales bacterium]|nr:glycoside hydrolase family 125 protein [Candidatus Acidoferrales bacterium]
MNRARVAPLVLVLWLLCIPSAAHCAQSQGPKPSPIPNPSLSPNPSPIPIEEPPETTTISLTLPGMSHRSIDLDADTLFHTLFWNFTLSDDGTTYVATGDIPAMWLRDSSAQTLPYIRFTPAFPQLEMLARGVVQRNARNILTDPYANAFTQSYKIWEEKWEVDSLSYPILLDSAFWRTTRDRSMFTLQLHWSFEHIVSTYECEQQHASCSHYRSPFLTNHGSGPPFAYTQMIWCAFRPSDDPVRYPYNIPQNMFAAYELDELARLSIIGFGDAKLAARATALAAQIRAAVTQYGIVYDFRYGWMYAYEVDGQGNFALMDDANIPNLLMLPFIGIVPRFDPVYLNTRRFSLSSDNPYWYRGKYGAGLGSAHTRTGWVWPLGIIGQALTASTAGEVDEVLGELRALDGGSGLFYESIDPDEPWHFTRSEFGWANAVYAELIFRCVAGLPPEPTSTASLPQLAPGSYTPPRITTDWEAIRAATTIYKALSSILSGYQLGA